MFTLVCHSVHRGGVCLVLGGCLVPPATVAVQGGSGPGGGCLVETPPDGYCCGRYASYWNAFLLREKGEAGGLNRRLNIRTKVLNEGTNLRITYISWSEAMSFGGFVFTYKCSGFNTRRVSAGGSSMSPEAWACHLDTSVSLRWNSGVVPHRFKYSRARQLVP